MAKFNAATAVEPMEYDFTSCGGPQGIIPEPSQEQIQTFFDNVKDVNLFVGKVMNDAEKLAKKAEESGESEDLEKYVEDLPLEKIREYQNEFAVWVSEVSGGTLEVEMLRGLPGRIFGAFFRWLTAELGPKGATSDTNP